MTQPNTPDLLRRTTIARAERLIPSLMALLAIYVVGGAIAVPVALWPPDLSDLTWRVRAEEMWLTTVPPLLLGVSIILIAGVLVGQHRVVRTGGVLFLALAVITTVLLPLFALDFLSVRHFKSQSEVGAFTRDGLRLGATLALMVPYMLWAGVRAWQAGRPGAGTDSGQGHGLVVGQS